MKRKIIYTGIGILFIFALAFSAYKLMNARNYQLFGNITSHIETHEKVVALTFDDGPTQNTDAILTLLDTYNVKATFFLIGKDIEENPEEAKKLLRQDIKLAIIRIHTNVWYSKVKALSKAKSKKQMR